MIRAFKTAINVLIGAAIIFTGAMLAMAFAIGDVGHIPFYAEFYYTARAIGVSVAMWTLVACVPLYLIVRILMKPSQQNYYQHP